MPRRRGPAATIRDIRGSCGRRMHGRPGGAEMDLAVPGLEVVAGLLGAERKPAGSAGHHVLDQGAWKAQTALFAHERPSCGAGFDARGQCLRQADALQHLERRTVDGLDIRLAQRSVATALQPRPHRAECRLERRRPQLAPCLASAASPAFTTHAAAPMFDHLIVARPYRNAIETSAPAARLDSPTAPAMLRP